MSEMSRRRMLGTIGAVGAVGAGAVGAAVVLGGGSQSDGADAGSTDDTGPGEDTGLSEDPAAEPAPRPIVFHAWEGPGGFANGEHEGTEISGDGHLALAAAAEEIEYTDPHTGTTRHYQAANWTSPLTELPFGASEVIASWNATTPSGTWVEVALQGVTDTGADTDWYVMARWTRGDEDPDIQRGTLADQRDTRAAVHTDVLAMQNNYLLTAIRVRATLHRLSDSTQTPEISLLGAACSALPDEPSVPVSQPGQAAGTVLDVPTYSQHLHKGHYPEWNGGGQAWCSPTCTAMVLDHWGLGPDAEETAWVDIPGENRPQVDHVTRYVFDYTYGGAGNWTFNTAYAAERGARAFITRLRSLREAEEFISAGVPLICSASFTAEELDGAGYGTNGHLLTIVGFDDDGDVVVNDPASQDEADDSKVRVTYRRDQFESIWLSTSGGLVYVITPADHPLPEPMDDDEPNWV